MAAEVARVINRCDCAKETQILDLSECLLENIPASLYLLMKNTTIVKCNLSKNNLKKVPLKFWNTFTDLVELDVSQNKVAHLPNELNLMSSLQVLNCRQNQLKEIPPSLYELKCLESIDLGNNHLEYVDVQSLCNMESLKEITLDGNLLTPTTMTELLEVDTFTVVLPDVPAASYEDTD